LKTGLCEISAFLLLWRVRCCWREWRSGGQGLASTSNPDSVWWCCESAHDQPTRWRSRTL